jgi:cytochrome P450
VDEYVAKLVDKSEKSSNYPGRLMQAGFTKSETRAQCKDLIFAGTDSTGMNLATICWRLSQNPDM